MCILPAAKGVGLAAMGIIESKLIKKGDPRRFVNGMDYQGNLCGITNYFTPGGEDTVNLPNAYPMPSGYLVCVDSCPKDTNYDKFICEYDVQHEIDNLFGTSEMAADEVDESKKGVYVFYASRKQCMPQVESVSFLGYCIPKLNEVILRTANSTLTDSSDSSSEVSIAIANKESSSSSDFFDKAMSDVMSMRYVIFGFGCGMSLVLGMMFLTIIKVPGVLHMLIWSAVIAIDVGLVAAGYHSKGVSAKWAADDIRPRNEATALFYASYVLYGLACVWTIVILFLRKRIMLAISCVREAAKAIGSMPMITLFPGLQVLGLVAFTVVWGLYMAFLASSGDIVVRCICHAVDGNTTLFEVETVESKDGLCNEGCLAHKEFKYTTNTKYAGLYLIFVWFWTSQFIVAMGQLVVSLAISLWYFNRNRRLVNNATFFRAFFLAATYHLGTAAFGSLVIAIVKTISAVLTYVQNKAAKSKLRVAVVLLSVLKCLLWCFEKVLKYINAQAYVQTGTVHIHFHIGRSVVLTTNQKHIFPLITAIFGYSFCKASKKGFFLILRNALRISAVAVVSRIVVFVGKIFITVASAVGGKTFCVW